MLFSLKKEENCVTFNKWIDLEDIMLSGIGQTAKTYCVASLFVEKGRRMVTAWDWGVGYTGRDW